MNKLIVIVGPTASGKTELSIKLAKKYNAEIVSADSRQIYREMDIGTAKPLDLREIPHWLLDIKNPNRAYTVAEYKKDAVKIIRDIQKIKANPLLRAKIEKEVKEKGLEYIFQKLVKLDPEAAYVIDAKNPRRVIRALEITLLTKKPFSQQRKSGMPLFDILEIGISVPN